jgi:hypothetical protein
MLVVDLLHRNLAKRLVKPSLACDVGSSGAFSLFPLLIFWQMSHVAHHFITSPAIPGQ